MSPPENALKDPLSVGDKVLDRYRVVERLETGGTSVVYRGEDERLSRPVCIKVFHTLREKEWIYRTTYEHFVQEAFALSKLSHPNTLRIYDFGHLPPPAMLRRTVSQSDVETTGGDGTTLGSDKSGDGDADGPPFQVSEFMNGGTLSTLVRREGPLGAPEANLVVTAICGALDEAHSHDIIHRDIKPKNILFGTSGQKRAPKLADFGIAKSLSAPEAAAPLTNRAGDTHVVAGRRLLMYSGLWAAPEQLAGQSVKPVSDLYSFALVTIFMLTGRCVFSSTDPTEAYRQRVDSDILIDTVMAEVDHPPAVTAFLKQACAVDPAQRIATADDFARALADAFESRTSRRRLPLEAPTKLTPVPRPAPEGLAGPRAGAGASRVSVDTDPGAVTTLPSRPIGSAPSGPPQRLALSPMPQPAGDRTATFVAMDSSGTADVTCAGGRARIRVSLVPSMSGLTLHVRGLSCFVRKPGGRASGAAQFDESGAIEMVLPNQQLIAHATIEFGSPAAGHSVFRIGDGLYALGLEECPRAVAFDLGSGGECIFVYVPRAAAVADERSAARGRKGRPA